MNEHTQSVLRAVAEERARQDAKWSDQFWLADGTGADTWRSEADDARAACKARVLNGTATWLDVLREEVYEAFAETDPLRLRTELIQVAAVAVAWIEALDRRQRGAQGQERGIT